MTDLCYVADMYHGNPVDFGKLAAATYNGVACIGVIHKATQGAGYPDPDYAKRRPLAIAAGLEWSGYSFNTGDPVVSQVAEFLKVAQPDAATGLWLDFEDNSASEMSLAMALEFMDRVDQATGRTCGIYSGDRMKTLIVPATQAQRDFLAAHGFWGAEYGTDFRDTDDAGKPLPWDEPMLWQDTGDGIGPQPHTLDGLQAGADLSVFKGSAAQLRAAWPLPVMAA